jgi:hypothetical protein
VIPEGDRAEGPGLIGVSVFAVRVLAVIDTSRIDMPGHIFARVLATLIATLCARGLWCQEERDAK